MTTVLISRYGNGLQISREGEYWKDFFDERAKDPIDFPDRDQPMIQEREDLDI
jgi:virulence-associated protein VagC|tara:strand:+ start:237 stop:395 length:159 start_codon:yes stop_codon:yes gene_type:complete